MRTLSVSRPTAIALVRQEFPQDYRQTAGGMFLVSRLAWREFLHPGSTESPDSRNGKKGNGERIPVLAISRVSDSKRARGIKEGEEDSDLARQETRLREWIFQNIGPQADITLARSVRSGLLYDPLTPLVSRILGREFRYCVATTWDRIVRFGIQLWEEICRAGECELIFTEADPQRQEYEDLSTEIIAILTSFAGRHHARRQGVRRRLHYKRETVERAYFLRREKKYPLKQIFETLLGEGHTVYSQEREIPITYPKVRLLFVEGSPEFLEAQILLKGEEGEGEGEGEGEEEKPNPSLETSTFRDFLQSHLVEKADSIISFPEIYEKYLIWCRCNDLPPESPVHSGRQVFKVVPRECVYKSTVRRLRGYALREIEKEKEKKRD